jgi:hypothetical protein
MNNNNNNGTGKDSTKAGMQAGQNTVLEELKERVISKVDKLFEFGEFSMITERLCHCVIDQVHDFIESKAEHKKVPIEHEYFRNDVFELCYTIECVCDLYEEYMTLKIAEQRYEQK